MAGNYGKLYKEIWTNPDFIALSLEAQHVYMMLISSEQITFAGVAPFVPGRFVALAKNLTDKKFAQAVKELTKARFIVVDTSSQEILIRTYIKHDDSLRNSKLAVAVAKAIKTVFSPGIKRELAVELAKLLTAHPELPGWEKLAEAVPEFFEMVSEHVLDGPAPEPVAKKGSSDAPSHRSSDTPSDTPSEDPSDEAYAYPIRYPIE